MPSEASVSKGESSHTIRPLTEADVAALHEIRLEALADSPDAFGTDTSEEAARPLSFQRDRVNNPNGVMHGAFDTAGKLVAIAGFALHTGMKEEHRGHVWGVYISPPARGGGLAKRFMTAILNDAFSRAEQVELEVLTTNPVARGLYVSLGFKTTGRIPGARKIDGVYHDDEFMLLRREDWAGGHTTS